MIFEAMKSLFVEQIGWLLIHSVWQFTLIAISVSVVLRLFFLNRNAGRHATCLIGMGLIAVAPIVTYLMLPDYATSGHDNVAVQFASPDPSSTVAAYPKISVDNTASFAAPSTASPIVAGPAASPVAAPPVAAPPVAASWRVRMNEIVVPWFTTLVPLWCCGVLLFAIRPALSLYTLSRLRRAGLSPVNANVARVLARAARRMGMSSTPGIFESALVKVPMVTGYLKPIILMPATVISGLSPQELEAIFLHELAHIRRHDFIVNLIQTLLETLFFYHPAVWWLSSTLRCEREHCCDTTAAEKLGNSATYGRALLKLEELQGEVPSLALGATHGSLLQRVERLGIIESRRMPRTGAIAILLVACGLAVGLAWTVGCAKTVQTQEIPAQAQTQGDAKDTDDVALTEEGVERPLGANQLAVRLHQQAARIDSLPMFYIRAKAGTETSNVKPISDVMISFEFRGPVKHVANESPLILKNLVNALDEPVIEEDWYRYESTFAWDPKRFVDESYTPSGNPPFRSTTWGAANAGGHRSQTGEEPPYLVLRKSASEIWKDHGLDSNYLLATTHKFWWGDNNFPRHCFSSIPPARGEYRELEEEEFDGELCDVVQSPIRQERLWFSQETGRLRGYLQLHYAGPSFNEDFYKSDAVKSLSGKNFTTHAEYLAWYEIQYEKLSAEQQLELILASLKDQNPKYLRPGILVRFRDYREILPGLWWPFQEDRVQDFSSNEGFRCMRSTRRVEEVRTDFDLEGFVRKLQPNEGETVHDQRFEVPVSYKYKEARTEEELLSIVLLAKQEKQQEDKRIIEERKRIIEERKKPYQELVGKTAPALSDKIWIGDAPDLTGKPYLIHFWDRWRRPCKYDYPLLKQMAKNGATIIGWHPSGAFADASQVKNAMDEAGLNYPTLLDSSITKSDDGLPVVGYPANMFPYCVLVDANGKVAAHGSLHENDGALISKFRELRQQAGIEK